jgi:hypothetical protein
MTRHAVVTDQTVELHGPFGVRPISAGAIGWINPTTAMTWTNPATNRLLGRPQLGLRGGRIIWLGYLGTWPEKKSEAAETIATLLGVPIINTPPP